MSVCVCVLSGGDSRRISVRDGSVSSAGPRGEQKR